jgi:hypothetical protein
MHPWAEEGLSRHDGHTPLDKTWTSAAQLFFILLTSDRLEE